MHNDGVADTETNGKQAAIDAISRAQDALARAVEELDKLPALDVHSIHLTAHALNNFLTVSRGVLDLLIPALCEHPDRQVVLWLEGLSHATDLMAHTVSQLMTNAVSLPTMLRLEDVDVERLVERACAYYRRTAEQKGIDRLLGALPEVLRRSPSQLAVLGSGEARYEEGLAALAADWPGRVAVHAGFDEGLAHRIEAGADVFLMPSRFEPCGLNQMYSLRYGTVPVVHATGGLDDTVLEFDPVSGRGTGFKFSPHTDEAFGRRRQNARNFAELAVGAGLGCLRLFADAVFFDPVHEPDGNLVEKDGRQHHGEHAERVRR